MDGLPKDRLLANDYEPAVAAWLAEPLDEKIAAIAAGSFRKKEPPAIRGSGYVVHCLEAALWAFHKTDTFRDGALFAVNLGEDADTTGAVYGQIAGAYYGEEGIPPEWRAVLAMRAKIEEAADRLYELAEARGARMTEEEWLTAIDPEPMLEWLSGRAHVRKLRLFSVCVLSSKPWRRSDEPRAGAARSLITAEQLADGLLAEKDRQAAESLLYQSSTISTMIRTVLCSSSRGSWPKELNLPTLHRAHGRCHSVRPVGEGAFDGIQRHCGMNKQTSYVTSSATRSAPSPSTRGGEPPTPSPWPAASTRTERSTGSRFWPTP